MVLGVALCGHEGLRGQERRLDGSEPDFEVDRDGPDVLLAVFAELVPDETLLARLLLRAVDCADERSALGGEHGLRVRGVAELAATVGVAARLGRATRLVQRG